MRTRQGQAQVHMMHLEWPINRSVGKGSLHIQIINPTNNPKMKAIVIICVLLASLLFSSPSIIVARELAVRDGTTGGTNKPAIPSCGKPGNPQYSSCIRNPKSPIKCGPKTVYGRCKPPQGP